MQCSAASSSTEVTCTCLKLEDLYPNRSKLLAAQSKIDSKHNTKRACCSLPLISQSTRLLYLRSFIGSLIKSRVGSFKANWSRVVNHRELVYDFLTPCPISFHHNVDSRFSWPLSHHSKTIEQTQSTEGMPSVTVPPRT
jgi:hypothetical protein